MKFGSSGTSVWVSFDEGFSIDLVVYVRGSGIVRVWAKSNCIYGDFTL